MNKKNEASVILEGYLQFSPNCLRTYDINHQQHPPVKEWMTIPIEINKVRQLIKEQGLKEREKVIIRGAFKVTYLEVEYISRSFIDPNPDEFFMRNVEIS